MGQADELCQWCRLAENELAKVKASAADVDKIDRVKDKCEVRLFIVQFPAIIQPADTLMSRVKGLIGFYN